MPFFKVYNWCPFSFAHYFHLPFYPGPFFLAPYSPVPIFQATMESMTMKGFSMLLQTVFWGCFINSIHNMSYYMEVSSCPTLPLSWVSNCPVSKCPVSSCPVSSFPGFGSYVHASCTCMLRIYFGGRVNSFANS